MNLHKLFPFVANLCGLAFLSFANISSGGNPSDTHVVHAFTATEGRPDSGLILGPDGLFYGTIENGGPNGEGIVYQVAPDGTTTTFFAFSDATGTSPVADSLVVGDDGNFYGILGSGGPVSGDHGVFYRLTPNGQYTAIHGFTEADGANGAYLDYEGPLTLGSDGAFWGISPASEYHQGAIFRLTKAGDTSIIVQFDGTDGAHTFGAGKVAKMITGPGNAFYGVLDDRVFRMPMVGAFNILHKFDTDADPDSGLPSSGIVFDRAGEIVGTTDSGAVYTIALVDVPFYNGSYTAVQNALPDGSCRSQLAIDRAGLIYGTATASDVDYVFVYYPYFRKVVDHPILFLPGAPIGTYQGEAETGLTIGTDGQFYGLTTDGATGGLGAVFAFAPFDDAPPVPNLVKFGNSHGFSESAKGVGVVTFKRVGDLTLPLTVNFKVVSPVNNGTYFTKIAKTITFPSLQDKAKLKIQATGALVGGSFNLTLMLKNNDPGYTIGNTSEVAVTITP